MEIIYKNIKDIKPYENNPRINDEAIEYVANSIKEFGFKNPIILDKNNVIIAGHTRLKACEKLGIKEIPCIIVDDLSEEQRKAYTLVHNKLTMNTDFDYSKLDEELENIIDIDMSMFDFNTDDLDIELDDDFEESKEIEKKLCKCPKCGHINEEKAFKYYEDTE